MPIRVLLADDSAVLRHAIRGLLENTEIEIVAETDDFAQAIHLTNKLKPEILVIDLHMKDDGISLSGVRPF